MATLGHTTDEATISNLANAEQIVYGPFTAGSDAGATTLMTMRLDGQQAAGSDNDYELVVYDDSSGAPGAEFSRTLTQTMVAGTAVADVAVAFSGTLVNGNVYWLGIYVHANAGTCCMRQRYVASGTGYAYRDLTLLGPPAHPTDPFGTPDATGSNFTPTVFVTYTPAGGGAPANTVLPAVTGTAQEGETLSCTTGTWTGDVSSGYAYQWYRDNYGDLVFADIPGATSATYVLTIADVDCDAECIVTATGTGGSTPATSNVVGLVIPAAPVAPENTVAPAVTGIVIVGQTLSVTTGTWDDDGSPTFTYAWQRDAAGNSVYSNIGSATASAYVLATADVGCHVRCVVTDTDANGATPANSNAVGLVPAQVFSAVVGFDQAAALVAASYP